MFPVIKGSYETSNEQSSTLILPTESVFYKNHVIAWAQEVSRSVDYLETRNDIAHDKFGFFSFSWGSTVAPIICATEKRISVAVFHAPGLLMQKTFPETDLFNFLPYIKIPVLMLNGKNDPSIPLEPSLNPMIKLLGTDKKDKASFVYDGGHLVPRSELIKETLFWFDKYLGPVK